MWNNYVSLLSIGINGVTLPLILTLCNNRTLDFLYVIDYCVVNGFIHLLHFCFVFACQNSVQDYTESFSIYLIT